MTQSNISIRVDNKVKEQFDNLCNELGLNMSTAINLFVKTAIREKRIPFEISLNTPNAKVVKAIEDAEKGIGLSKEFTSVEEVMNDMLED